MLPLGAVTTSTYLLTKGLRPSRLHASHRIRTPFTARIFAEENHPTTKDQVAALLVEAAKNGGKVDWVNCGMCVDERGVNEFVPGTRRGSPADFQAFIDASDNTLVIPTK